MEILTVEYLEVKTKFPVINYLWLGPKISNSFVNILFSLLVFLPYEEEIRDTYL